MSGEDDDGRRQWLHRKRRGFLNRELCTAASRNGPQASARMRRPRTARLKRRSVLEPDQPRLLVAVKSSSLASQPQRADHPKAAASRGVRTEREASFPERESRQEPGRFF
jgi:hypothetical protein